MPILFGAQDRVKPARPLAGPLTPGHAADEATGADVESDPADWPDWTDDYRYELGPDPDDAEWAAENLNETFDADPPADHVPAESEPDWDAMFRESWAVHCLESGLDPFDPYLPADPDGLIP